MTGHKEVWNMIIHSRFEWPYGHPLHDLDVIVLSVFLFICFLCFTAVIQMELKFRSWSKKLKTTPSEELDFLISREQWIKEGGLDHD